MLLDDFFFQLEQRQNAIVLAVEIFGRFVFLGAGGDDGGAVANFPDPSAPSHLGREVSDKAVDTLDRGIGRDVDRGMFIDLADEIVEVGLHIHAFQRVVKSARHASQVGGFLQQVNLKSLLGHVERAGHAGHTAADDQNRFVDRQFDFLQRLQQRRSRHGHADDVFCLRGSFVLFAGMNPGAMFPDIRHIQEVLIDAAFTQRVAEQRLVRARVQAAITTRLRPLSRMTSAICWAFSVEHANRLSCACVTLSSLEAYSTTEGTLTTRPIFAPQWQTNTPTLGSSAETSRSCGYSRFSAQLAALVRQQLTAKGFGRAGRYDRFRDVEGPWKAPLTKIPGREVSIGLSGLVLQNPWEFSSIPNLLARSPASLGGLNPTDRTMRSNSSSFTPSPSVAYLMVTFLLSGISLRPSRSFG